jgi:hypothetical protein
VLYRYMPYDLKRIKELLSDGKLYMPCPAELNDPFDCSLDDSMRLTFFECAIGCFSTVPDNVLIFSHYADGHRGLCVGFNRESLVLTMTQQNPGSQARFWPVWYFPVMPKLSNETGPALCATCKHDIWKYEKEYRLFMLKGTSLLPSAAYSFVPKAIVEVIFGYCATDESRAKVKSFTRNIPNYVNKKAVRAPRQFGVRLEKIN